MKTRDGIQRFARCALILLLFVLGAEGPGLAQSGDVARILGFEAVADWQLIEGIETPTTTAALSEGAAAVELSGSGWRRLRSVGFSPGAIGTTLRFDVALSSPAAGWETVGAILEVPSAGIFYQDLGSQPLTGMAQGEVRSFQFSVPAAVRSALASGNEVFVSVVFNGGQSVVLDNLNLGLASPPPDPPPTGSSTVCLNRELELVDIDADFRDIWAGREDVETGKRTDATPTITLRFNRPVDARRLSAKVVGFTAGSRDAPADCVDAAGNFVDLNGFHHLWLTGDYGVNSWQAGFSVEGVTQSAPLDFNVLVFGDISGLPDAHGPVAAGGNVTLTSFSLNTVSRRKLGAMVGGVLSASNGTIFGDLAHGPAAPALNGVTLTGIQHPQLPLDFLQLKQRLTAMSDSLFNQTSSGSAGDVSLVGSHLSLIGTDPELNVFVTSASAPAAARSVEISVPPGAAALVNVLGSQVSLTNAQVSLNGVSRSRLLWNFPEATALELSSVSFQGSALAPRAAVTANNGNFEGTLVADSLSGSMQFHDFPLLGWQSFGGTATGDTLTLRPQGRLRAGCEYTLLIDATPAAPDGSCLAEPVVTSFLVTERPKTAFDREMASRRFSRRRALPISFAARAGINTPIEDVPARYARTFRLRPGLDTLTAIGDSAPSPITPALQIVWFQQFFRDVPVLGNGYLVQHESGTFRSAVGNLLPDLAISTEPGISPQQAIDAALAVVNPAQRPWQANPPTAPPPEADLVLRSMTFEPAPPDLRLLWRVRLHGIDEAELAEVDATTGQVVFAQPRARRITACEGFDAATATLSEHVERDVAVPFNDTDVFPYSDLLMGIWQQGSTTYEAFDTRQPFPYRTRFSVVHPNLERTTTEHVCAGADPDTLRVAAAHWAVRNAARTFSDAFGWAGVTGSTSDPLSVTVFDAQAMGVETGFLPKAGSLPDRLNVLTTELFPGAIAHEFAHGVSRYSRLTLGMDSRLSIAESGSLEEAYADILSVLAVRRAAPELVDPWCLTFTGENCDRDMAAPKLSATAPGDAMPGLPDTYLGEQWTSTESGNCTLLNNYCGIHENSTVVSHWFYTLVNGRSATELNDHGCASGVPPLALDLDAALLAGGQLVFSSFRQLQPDAGFQDARIMTSVVAEQLLGIDARYSVDKAWHAVGVGEGPTPLVLEPQDGATDVEPWSATLRFSVAEPTGPWTIRVSTSPEFEDPSYYTINTSVDIEGIRYASINLTLDAGKTYYWQGREGELLPATSWDICETFTASFTTADKQVKIVTPKSLHSEGYYLTNHQGRVVWEWLAGASSYEVLLRDSDDGCETPASEWTDIGNPTGADPDFHVLRAS